MPHEKDASTQNSTDEVIGGFDREEPQKEAESCSRHQAMSERTLGLGSVCRSGPVRSFDPQGHGPGPRPVHHYHKMSKDRTGPLQDRSLRS
jgi:hypothetical protein